MARLARIVVPHLPHPVTQRGNRREPIFFEDGDHEVDRDLLGGAVPASRNGWNCVHLILTPKHADQLGDAVGEAQSRYHPLSSFRYATLRSA